MTIRSANSLIRRAKRKNTADLIKMAVLLLLIFGAYAVVRWVDFREVLNPERGVAYLNASGPLAPVVFMMVMAMAVVISPITPGFCKEAYRLRAIDR